MINDSMKQKSWQVLTKVPRLTIYFWIIKLLTTAMGEATSDLLVYKISPYIAVAVGFIILVVALIIQFAAKKYEPWKYWLAALAVSIAGTMGADVMHVGLGVPYIASTIFYLIVLGLILFIWYKSEHTLSIHSIYTKKRETFYWATVLATFALGTAAGDLTAYTFKLGFLLSAGIFIFIFIIPCILYWRLHFNPIFTFWFAYIFTRPIGASFADWFSKPVSVGGLGLGDLSVSVVLFVLIIILVAYSTINRVDSYTQ
ncbi:MAG TPA: hypothetical protein VMR16_00110 [Candidatus Saccharimonadales bacterium]|nr:hypothetical protein [Candidatus Saccharimonadales bacterium]